MFWIRPFLHSFHWSIYEIHTHSITSSGSGQYREQPIGINTDISARNTHKNTSAIFLNLILKGPFFFRCKNKKTAVIFLWKNYHSWVFLWWITIRIKMRNQATKLYFIISVQKHCSLPDRLSTRELNPVCLKLDKFAHFQLVALARRQPCFDLRIEILLNFSAFKVEEF